MASSFGCHCFQPLVWVWVFLFGRKSKQDTQSFRGGPVTAHSLRKRQHKQFELLGTAFYFSFEVWATVFARQQHILLWNSLIRRFFYFASFPLPMLCLQRNQFPDFRNWLRINLTLLNLKTCSNFLTWKIIQKS